MSPVGVNAGQAFLTVDPDLKDFGKKLESEVGSAVERSSSGLASKFAGLGKAAAVGLGAAATGLAAFGAQAAHKFSEVGGEVAKLTRLTGGSAEEMSKLRFAAKETGIDTDQLGKSIGILSKHLAAGDDAAKSIGVSFADAKGKSRPLNDVLLDIAERFKSMPDGVQKNAEALKLFGRAGLDLIPFLNKGKAGLSELEAEAQKFGLVLSKDNLAAIKANVVAHREFHAALEGLQVQAGQYVLPIITKLTSGLTQLLAPAMRGAATIGRTVLAPAFSFVGDKLEASFRRIKGAVDSFSKGFQDDFRGNFFARVGDDLSNFIAGFQRLNVGPITGFVKWGNDLRTVLDLARWNVSNFFEGFREGAAGLEGDAGFAAKFGAKIHDALVALKADASTFFFFFRQGLSGTGGDWAKITEPLGRVAFFLGEVAKKAADFAKANPAVVISGLAGAITGAGLLPALSNLAGLLGSLGSALPLLANPVGLTAAALALLAGGFAFAYTHSKAFHDFIDQHVLPKLREARDAAGGFWKGITEDPGADAGLQGTAGKFESFGQRVRTVFETAKADFKQFIDGFKNPDTAVGPGQGDFFANLGASARTAFEGLGPILDNVKAKLADVFSAAGGQISTFLDWVHQISPAFEEAMGHIGQALATVVGTMQELWGRFGDTILGKIHTVWLEVQLVIDTAVRVIRDTIGGALDLINGDWGKAWDKFQDIPQAALKLLTGSIGNALRGIGDTVKTTLNIADLLVDIGEQLISGLLKGIKNKAGDIAGTIKDSVVDKIPGFLKSALGISSPSTVMAEIGVNIVDGLIQGMKSREGALTSTTTDLAKVWKSWSDVPGYTGFFESEFAKSGQAWTGNASYEDGRYENGKWFPKAGAAGTNATWADYQGYASGGVVPGPIGAPVPAIVHGGETVFTPEQMAAVGGANERPVIVDVYLDKDKIARATSRGMRRRQDAYSR